MDGYNWVSFAGIFILAGVAWALSADRRNVNWRVIGWGIGLQLLIALFVFVVPAGAKVFLVVNDAAVKGIGPIAARALVAATLACLMTACVAGTFFTEGSILLGGS